MTELETPTRSSKNIKVNDSELRSVNVSDNTVQLQVFVVVMINLTIPYKHRASYVNKHIFPINML
jgi:hypothetical protein